MSQDGLQLELPLAPFEPPSPIPASEPFFDLGTHRRPITTGSADAQAWFDRGLVWCFAFNHDAGAKCFGQALAHDGDAVAAYWGLAYALGPNYNRPWALFDAVDRAATVKQCRWAVAEGLKRNPRGWERALLEAIRERFPLATDDPGELAACNERYVTEMVKVYAEYGRGEADLDIAALTADALMSLTPWKLWDIHTGKPAADARTIDVQAILERGLASEAGRSHPGLLHLWIHLIEMSPNPELGIGPGDLLRGLCPDAGHMAHMPSHIDLLVGDYDKAIATNWLAAEADERYYATEADEAITFYAMYRLHVYDSIVYAAMLAGQYGHAIRAVERLEAAITERMLRQERPAMRRFTETYRGTRAHVNVRFGKWHEILALEMPHDKDLYLGTTTVYHYAKGIAHAALGNVQAADEALDSYRAALQRVPDDWFVLPNKASHILSIGEPVLMGEIAYRRGRYEEAFALLREAVHRYDNLSYAEPWPWMMPVRHALAALLLEQDRVEEAAEVYAEDLGLSGKIPRGCQHRNNVWGLHGYHECLVRLGRTADAALFERPLAIALAAADVPINASCFCRLEACGDARGRCHAVC